MTPLVAIATACFIRIAASHTHAKGKGRAGQGSVCTVVELIDCERYVFVRLCCCRGASEVWRTAGCV